MSYRRSEPLTRWLEERATTIATLAAGHASVGGVTNRVGRPLDVSKPLAHGYIIVMLREFQAFVRDLHDLAAVSLVSASSASATYEAILIEGLTKDRAIDRGNATGRSIKQDFGRLGITPINISAHNSRWVQPGGTDAGTFDVLIQLRNALGHGNESELKKLVDNGRAKDNVSWARQRIPVLNRYARALDRLVWDHLSKTTGKEPW